MSSVDIGTVTTTVTLTLFERIVSLRGDISVPTASVLSVAVVEDALAEARGVRAPGLGLPGVRKVGTWRRAGERAFVSVRRGQPAVRISLKQGGEWASLLVGNDRAVDVARTFAESV